METLRDIIIIAGLGSLGAMWVFIVLAMLHAFWDTVGEHAMALIRRFKR